MRLKTRLFFRNLRKRFRSWRKKNLIGRHKVKTIALGQTDAKADAIVKRETDGDGGWRPNY